MRVCPRCKTQKDAIEFYGKGYCKRCASEKSREWYLENKKRKAEINRGWRDRNKERRKVMLACTNAFHKALRNGTLKKGIECTFCQSKDSIEGAHTDYSKPLDVIWLCRKCHRLWDHQNPKTKDHLNGKGFIPVQVAEPIDMASVGHATPEGRTVGSNPATGDKHSTLRALRALMSETITQPVADSAKPLIFRDDGGRVISEHAWKTLQKKKEKAKAGGYVLDD